MMATHQKQPTSMRMQNKLHSQCYIDQNTFPNSHDSRFWSQFEFWSCGSFIQQNPIACLGLVMHFTQT
jgi:hypothetical protein